MTGLEQMMVKPVIAALLAAWRPGWARTGTLRQRLLEGFAESCRMEQSYL